MFGTLPQRAVLPRLLRRVAPASLPALLLLAAGCSREPSGPQGLYIIYTNNTEGEIRSCGCVSNDLGGLGRRATFVGLHRRGGHDVLLLEGGDMFGVDINYGREKADLTLRSYGVMGYLGIAVGEKDLIYGTEFLRERAEALKLPVLSATIFDTETQKLVFPPFHIAELTSGLQVGVIGVTEGVELPEEAAGLGMSSARTAVDRLVPKLRSEHKVDLVVVLAHMPYQNLRVLAKGLTGVDVIVTGHDARPTRKLARMGGAYVLTTSDRGRFIGLTEAILGDDGKIASMEGGLRGLGVDLEDDTAVAKLFQTYDMDVRRAEKANAAIPAGHPERRFAGAEECMACHEDIYAQWLGTKHAHAFDVLSDQDRQYDRDCTPCHTVGFYQTGGFLSVDQTPDLIHVQCEACHGNSAGHALNPDVKPPGNARQACTNCHNEHQSPDFEFDAWWARIQH